MEKSFRERLETCNARDGADSSMNSIHYFNSDSLQAQKSRKICYRQVELNILVILVFTKRRKALDMNTNSMCGWQETQPISSDQDKVSVS